MEKRIATRSDVQAKSEAIVKYEGRMIRGKVDNLGATGIFILTNEHVPINKEVEIRIIFLPDLAPFLTMTAKGIAVRYSKEGIGFRFSEIDILQLGQCVTTMINVCHDSQKTKNPETANKSHYTLPPSKSNYTLPPSKSNYTLPPSKSNYTLPSKNQNKSNLTDIEIKELEMENEKLF
ncbi:MAG: PilZ domain-containing protein [Desulfobacterales bacterium]|nr:PilZ domain-containing protein [Desulfobacterales bacterium]